MPVTGSNTENQDMEFVVQEMVVKDTLTVNGNAVTGAAVDAADVTFTSAEGLTATDVAAALDELKALIDGLA